MYAVEAVEIEKSYALPDGGAVAALRGVSLQVVPGEIFALLGPNGAGKTTLLSILTTLLPPTNGAAKVAGFDVVSQPAAVKRRIAVTFQELVVDGDLSGRRTLEYHGALYGLDRKVQKERIAELARLVELEDVLDRKVETYSGGMKRRLELVRGLLTDPVVLFLDEPTQGLDPQNRVNIWKYVRELREQRGLTIVLTTHYMEEAETLADRVAIIDHGQVVGEGRPAELIRTLGADVVTISGNGSADALAQRLGSLSYVTHVTRHTTEEQHLFQIGVDDGDGRLAELVATAAGAGFNVQRVNVNRPTLGDVFLAYTGEALRDA